VQSLYFQNTIKRSFCLLSWLIPNYEIRIIDEVIIDEASKVKIFSKSSLGKLYTLYERKNIGSLLYSFGITAEEGADQKTLIEKVLQGKQ
jgi:hypothetical protein